jgi:hypothetical protein
MMIFRNPARSATLQRMARSCRWTKRGRIDAPASVGQNSRSESTAELEIFLHAVVEGLCGFYAAGNVILGNDAGMKISHYRTESIIGDGLKESRHHGVPDEARFPPQECAIRTVMKVREAIRIVSERTRATTGLVPKRNTCPLGCSGR